MAATVDTISGLLKTKYGKNFIRQQQNLKAYLWEQIPKAPEKPTGEGFVFGIHVSGNMAGGPLARGDSLNRAQVERTRQARLSYKTYHWPIEIDGEARDIAGGGMESFLAALDFQITEATKSFRKLLNQDTYRNGHSVRTTVPTAQGPTDTLVVADAQMVRQNTVCDIYDAAGTTRLYQGVQCIGVLMGANSLKFNRSDLTVPQDAVIVQHGTRDNAPVGGKSLTGLERIVDTTTEGVSYLGVDASVDTAWQATRFDAGGVISLSNDLLTRIHDRVEIACGDGDVLDFLVSSTFQRRKYLSLVTPMRQYDAGQKEGLDTGYKTLVWTGGGHTIPWKVDTDCQRDKVWMLDKGGIECFEVRAMDWDDTSGAILKQVNNEDAFWAYQIWRGDIATRDRNHHAQITGLQVPAY